MTKLSERQRSILNQSLREFEGFSPHKQKKWYDEIIKRIKIHEDGLNKIGFGFCDNFVLPAYEFIRIVEKKFKQLEKEIKT